MPEIRKYLIPAVFAGLMVFFFAGTFSGYLTLPGPPICTGSALCVNGPVERVIDGDTLVVGNITVRLALVSTPEIYETGGKEAYNFTSGACPVGSGALVDEDDYQTKGSYGRMVAVVYCNNKNLNELLLEKGFGEIYTSFCEKSEFKNKRWAKRYGC